MNQQPAYQPPHYEEEEVTLKDIILTIKSYCKEIYSSLRLLVIFILLAIGLAYYFASFQKTTYTTGLSFLIKNNAGKKATGGVSPDLLRLGIGLGIENNKIKELARSGAVINKVLLTKVQIDGKEDFFANHLIDIYGYQARWNNEPIAEDYKELQLKAFRFSHKDIEIFEPKEYRALSILRDLIVGNKISGSNGILSIIYDKTTDITKFQVVSKNGNISLELINLVFSELKAFYTEETIGRSRRNFKLLTSKVDSLEIMLKYTQGELAKATDQTYGLVSKADLLKRGQLEREVSRINNIYQNLLGKKQDVEYNLSTDTPDFMMIDQTFLPIEKAISKLMYLLLGTFVGFFLGIGFIIFRKIIRDALAG